ncbi:hypothetical protein NPIL_305791 [Nephila pilipes]|uniref:Uncharacterized protein n=1 Tax=Nephila pilipes TaxID=299642 RepID=A0A8X6Q7L8_NEPPI|nr:hypothetical protein NPIL_305791 [Nephila pilipes]
MDDPDRPGSDRAVCWFRNIQVKIIRLKGSSIGQMERSRQAALLSAPAMTYIRLRIHLYNRRHGLIDIGSSYRRHRNGGIRTPKIKQVNMKGAGSALSFIKTYQRGR